MSELKRPALGDYLLLTALAAVFGASFMFTNIALQSLPPLTVASLRLLLAVLLILPLMYLAGQRLPRGRIWWVIVACGFFGNALPFALISWGQVRVDAGLTAIFMALMPLATVALAQLFTSDEKLNQWKVAGVLLGLLGVVVLMGFDALTSLGDSTLRQLAIAAATLCYAINAILTRQLTALPKRSMICALLLSATLMLLPVSLWLEQPWGVQPTLNSSLAVVALALGPTALATLIILVIIERQGASFLSTINFMVPVFGVLFGAVFLAERLPANAWLALMIIMLGIALVRRGGREAPPQA